jgi:hypothetical protein
MIDDLLKIGLDLDLGPLDFDLGPVDCEADFSLFEARFHR